MKLWALVIIFMSVQGGTEKVTIDGFESDVACKQYYDESIVSVHMNKRKLRMDGTVLTAICLPTSGLNLK